MSLATKITSRIEDGELHEVTGHSLYNVLLCLYNGRHIIDDTQGSITPAMLERMKVRANPPNPGVIEDAVKNGYIPDYFLGYPIKVTTEYYNQELTQAYAWCDEDKPADCRMFIGRLDLFDRDNGKGKAKQALNNLTMMAAMEIAIEKLPIEEIERMSQILGRTSDEILSALRGAQ